MSHMTPLSEILEKALASRLIGNTLGLLGRLVPRPGTTDLWFQRLFPGSLRLHRRRLVAKLRAMPFIYGDLEGGDILTDFVDVEYRALPAQGTELRPRGPFLIDSDEGLRRKKKVLIIGAPGIGKTTFVRHVILSLLGAVPPLPFFYREERLVPFYVPLKAIDNCAPHPILRYLLANEPLLKAKGALFLKHLAEEHRVFLVLDGYDEVPFSEGLMYVHHELEALMAGKLAGIRQQDKTLKDVYPELASARIWLTSRPQFLRKHPLPFQAFAQKLGADVGSLVVELLGIGDNW